MEKSLINAINYTKRKANKESTSYYEILEDGAVQYRLTKEEIKILDKKMLEYCKNNYIYKNEIRNAIEYPELHIELIEEI